MRYAEEKGCNDDRTLVKASTLNDSLTTDVDRYL